VTEGTAGGARFVVTRSGNTAVAGSIDWSVKKPGYGPVVSDREGLVFADFPLAPNLPVWMIALPSGRLDFAPGQTSCVLEILVADDTHAEADEDFEVWLSPSYVDGFLGQTPVAKGRIIDNDAPAFVSISPIVAEQTEGPGAALVFRVHRAGGTDGPADVW